MPRSFTKGEAFILAEGACLLLVDLLSYLLSEIAIPPVSISHNLIELVNLSALHPINSATATFVISETVVAGVLLAILVSGKFLRMSREARGSKLTAALLAAILSFVLLLTYKAAEAVLSIGISNSFSLLAVENEPTEMNHISLLFWLIDFILINQLRTIVVVFWLAVLFGSVILLYPCKSGRLVSVLLADGKEEHKKEGNVPEKTSHQSSLWKDHSFQRSWEINIMIRKVFHFVCVIMFIPALLLGDRSPSPLLDISFIGTDGSIFMEVAFSFAFALLLLIEALRYSRFPLLGGAVDRYMTSFLDERDQGEVILSHLYLLIGCAIPVWWSSSHAFHPLGPFSGLLMLGIGDSMVTTFLSRILLGCYSFSSILSPQASIVGIKIGRLKWRGLNKTIEGSLGAFLSVLLSSLLILQFTQHSPFFFSLIGFSSLLLTIGCACLMEAFCTQNDNLVLPFYFECLLAASFSLLKVFESI